MQDAIVVLLAVLAGAGTVCLGIAADVGQEATTAASAPTAPDPNEPAGPEPNAPAQPSSVTATPAAPEIIKSIEFEGNRKFKAHVLRQRLGFELGERLDPFLAEGGRLTIAEVYRRIGYPSVKVSLDRERLADGHLLYRIEEGPRAQVASVDFVGNDTFGSWTLNEIVKTAERKWFLWPYYFTEEAVDEDVGRLQDFYYGRGYLDHKIAAETEFTEDAEKVYVTFVIEEGPVYRMAEIAFTGNTRFTDEQLREHIELTEGDVYLKLKAERDARKLTELYREQGYVDAEVRQNPKFTSDVEDNQVILEFTVREGQQFRIGQIEVTGNEITKDKVVRRIMDEYGFTPGELYDGKIAPKEGNGLLEKYIQRGATASEVMIRPVAPAVVDPNADPNQRDVRVDIEEGMTGLIRPGVGFSSDHGVIGQLIYQQYNFDITDWPESLREALFPWTTFRGAGQRLSVMLEPGTRYSQYSVRFSDPYWRDEPIRMDVEGRAWDWYRESHDEGRLRGALEFERRLENRWRRSIGFRGENVTIDDLDYDAPQEIRDFEGDTTLFGAKVGLGITAVDNIYDPTSGQRASAFYEQVTGDDAFGVLEGSYVRYFPLHEDVLGRRTVLAAKVLAGTIVGSAPPFEKYYAGGTRRYGIRGFEYRGVSTRGLQTNVDPASADYKDPVGSDWIFLASTEVTVPLVGENFGLLFFLDSGTVDTGSYRLSIGTGIEIKVPQIFGNMPMRFELATPLLRDDEDERQIFSFSGGGLF